MSDDHLTAVSFKELGLHPKVLQGIEEAGFLHCTPIQAEALPAALAGLDIAGQAQTGTGKTAAFLLATFHRLLNLPPDPNRQVTQPLALILAPTRELAIQIHKDAQVLVRHTGFKLGLAYGGTGYEMQRQEIAAGVDILIGTPGRLIDYFKQHVYNLKAIQVVVLDEADRMFDLGFIKDLRYLLRRMPPPEQRLGLLFSATLSHRVNELAYEHMNNPKRVEIAPEKVTTDRIKQLLYHTANNEKIPLLIGLLNSLPPGRSMVFTNTKRVAEKVWGFLEGNGYRAGLLSGDIPQKTRQRLLQEFKDGGLAVLVATDVAARGLHIPDVTHVFNFDLPHDSEDYVHRIGRTGRLNAVGDAISFACEQYVYSLPEIESYVGDKIPVAQITPELLAKLQPPAKSRFGRSGPKRSGGPNSRGGGDKSSRPRRPRQRRSGTG